MSKTLNTNAITNELEHSSFFPARRSQAQSVEVPAPLVSAPVVKPTPAPEVVEPATVIRPQQEKVARKQSSKQVTAPEAATRAYVRRTFDFFDDQIAYLTKASLEDRLAGGEGSMNAMVREAIDDLIEKRKRSKR